MINYSLFKKFKSDLPEKPYYAKGKDKGLKIASKEVALKNPYIQFNSPFVKNFMVFDIDKQDSSTVFLDTGLIPNFMITNKENGHSHYYYLLEKGVYFTKNSKKTIQNWYNNIYKSLCYKLDADISFSGLIAKNPFYKCDGWQTVELTSHLYTLDELSGFCDFEYLEKTNPNKFFELGRNCSLFDCLRFFAYKEIRKLKYDYQSFWNSCKQFIQRANKHFSNPLSQNEIKHILKSVCNWVYKHFSEKGFLMHQKKANKRSQQARKEKALLKINECKKLSANGLSARQISCSLQYPLSSVYRYIKIPI